MKCRKIIIYANLIEYLIEQNELLIQQGKNGHQMLDNLIKHRSKWLPIDLIMQGVPEMFFTTNRIEGNFGCFKQFYGHTRKTIKSFVKELINQTQLSITESFSGKIRTINEFRWMTIIDQEKIDVYGKYLLKVLSEELQAYNDKKDNPFVFGVNLEK